MSGSSDADCGKRKFCNDVQPKRTPSPIAVSPEGRLSSSSDRQEAKARRPTVRRRVQAVRSRVRNALEQKASSPIDSRAGASEVKTNDFRFSQPENAFSPIPASLPPSASTDANERQPRNAERPTVSTPAPSFTSRRASQPAKAPVAIRLTEAGTVRDVSPAPSRAPSLISVMLSGKTSSGAVSPESE